MRGQPGRHCTQNLHSPPHRLYCTPSLMVCSRGAGHGGSTKGDSERRSYRHALRIKSPSQAVRSGGSRDRAAYGDAFTQDGLCTKGRAGAMRIATHQR